MKSCLALAICAAFLVAACSDIDRTHGYAPANSDLARIEVGATSKEQVTEIAGAPAIINRRYGEAWFYVASRFRVSGPNEPEEVERRIVQISFDGRDRVAAVAEYALADGRDVPLVRRITENNLGRVTILNQLGDAFGRIDPGAILQGN